MGTTLYRAGVAGLYDSQRPDDLPFSPKRQYLVKLACELPDEQGRSLSQWDCTELARQLITAGVVGTISAATVRRILQSNQLKPWQVRIVGYRPCA